MKNRRIWSIVQYLVSCLRCCSIDVLGWKLGPVSEKLMEKENQRKAQRKKKKLNSLWYGDNWEIWDGNMMPGVTFLCLFSASDLPLCAGHTWLLSTGSKVSRHTAACHSAASQTRQCDVGSPITWSLPYLPDPVFIFQITPTAQNKADGLSQLFWRISEIYNGFPKKTQKVTACCLMFL